MSFGMVALIGGVIAALAFAAAPSLAPLARLDAGSFRYLMAIVYSDALLAVPFAHLRMTHRALRYAVLRMLFVASASALNIVLIGQLHWGVVGDLLCEPRSRICVVLALSRARSSGWSARRCCAGAAWRPLWAYALPVMPATLAVMLVENGDRITLNYLPDPSPRRSIT